MSNSDYLDLRQLVDELDELRNHTRIKAEIEIDVPNGWIRTVTQEDTLFGRPYYCGYWLFGVAHDEKLGWLVYEQRKEGVRPDKKLESKVIAQWRTGIPDDAECHLPKHWFRLNKETAIEAYIEGVKRWGVDWYE